MLMPQVRCRCWIRTPTRTSPNTPEQPTVIGYTALADANTRRRSCPPCRSAWCSATYGPAKEAAPARAADLHRQARHCAALGLLHNGRMGTSRSTHYVHPRSHRERICFDHRQVAPCHGRRRRSRRPLGALTGRGARQSAVGAQPCRIRGAGLAHRPRRLREVPPRIPAMDPAAVRRAGMEGACPQGAFRQGGQRPPGSLLLSDRPEGRRRLGDRGEQRGLRRVADRVHP